MNLKLTQITLILITIFSFQGFAFAENKVEDKKNEQDSTVSLFVLKCAGCHTFGGGALTGPDLIMSATFPREDLIKAIERMQEKVGPMDEKEIKLFADFIKSENVQEKIKNEFERQAKLLEAKLDPSNSKLGKKLFYGNKSLQNGGLSCVSCHTVRDYTLLGGGRLGPSLNNVFQKYSKNNLVSAIENANWKVMKDVYKNHKITKQESIHLVAYLESIKNKEVKPTNYLFHVIGLFGFIFFLSAIAFLYRNRLTDMHKKIRRK